MGRRKREAFPSSHHPPRPLYFSIIAYYFHRDTQREPLQRREIHYFFGVRRTRKNANKGEGKGQPRDRGEREIEI